MLIPLMSSCACCSGKMTEGGRARRIRDLGGMVRSDGDCRLVRYPQLRRKLGHFPMGAISGWSARRLTPLSMYSQRLYADDVEIWVSLGPPLGKLLSVMSWHSPMIASSILPATWGLWPAPLEERFPQFD